MAAKARVSGKRKRERRIRRRGRGRGREKEIALSKKDNHKSEVTLPRVLLLCGDPCA